MGKELQNMGKPLCLELGKAKDIMPTDPKEIIDFFNDWKTGVYLVDPTETTGLNDINAIAAATKPSESLLDLEFYGTISTSRDISYNDNVAILAFPNDQYTYYFVTAFALRKSFKYCTVTRSMMDDPVYSEPVELSPGYYMLKNGEFTSIGELPH